MEFWTVKVYYGGDGPVQECFESKQEAYDFYNAHNYCDKPEKFTAKTPNDEQWARMRILNRENATIIENE